MRERYSDAETALRALRRIATTSEIQYTIQMSTPVWNNLVVGIEKKEPKDFPTESVNVTFEGVAVTLIDSSDIIIKLEKNDE